MKRSHFWWGIGACTGMVILILDSRTAISGAREGIELCVQTVIPSLFPFFVLSILLTGAFSGGSLPLLRPIARLFRIPCGYESLLVPGFLGGYPVGAQCIGQAFREGRLSKENSHRLLTFCSNAGPAFLFGILGNLFPKRWMVWALWGTAQFSALLCAQLQPESDQEEVPHSAVKEVSLPNALHESVRIMGSVCGWIVLFRVVIAFFQRWFLWILPKAAQVIVMGVLELSNGCCELQNVEDVRLRFVICSGLLSFGGLCVVMQTASVIGKLSILPYLAGKALQTCFSILFSTALIYTNLRPLVFIPIVSCLILKKIVAFTGSMMYNKNTNLRRNPYAVSKKNGTLLRLLPPRRSAG